MPLLAVIRVCILQTGAGNCLRTGNVARDPRGRLCGRRTQRKPRRIGARPRGPATAFDACDKDRRTCVETRLYDEA